MQYEVVEHVKGHAYGFCVQRPDGGELMKNLRGGSARYTRDTAQAIVNELNLALKSRAPNLFDEIFGTWKL